MESLDGRLGRLFETMTESQKRAYKAKAEPGRSVENLVLVAESILGAEARDRGSIRRNCGATRSETIAESHASLMQEADDLLLTELAKARPQSCGKLVKNVTESTRLTATQEADKQFALLVGLSEADAEKVAKSNCLRD